MPKWLVERGIGEDRALLMDGEKVLAARLRWPGDLAPGAIVSAWLVARAKGSARGTARTDDGTEILVDRLPPGASEGSAIEVRIVRDALAERGRLKRALGRVAEKGEAPLPDEAFDSGREVARFPAGTWEEVWDLAWEAQADFAGGSLLFATTPGMSVIDIDGALAPRDLALAAVAPIARAIRLLDLAGSIAIDFPTLATKADRKAVDAALAEALAGWPHERTAINGFGLVQLVARLERVSLLHRLTHARAGAAARMALRRAESSQGAGNTVLLTAHPAVAAQILPEWREQCARRAGRAVRIATDPAIAIGAAHAQIVSE